jgi:hypothetical protein
MARIDLRTPLTLRNALLFPLQNARSRKEVFIGGLLLLIPFVGWLLNMGHRIAIVHSMQTMTEPWPAWHSWRRLLRHGLVTWFGMIYYYLPGAVLLLAYRHSASALAGILAVVLIVLATIAIPGYMTHYCKRFDAAEIFNPAKALRRSFEGGGAYWRAWAISLAALLLSLSGLLVFGVGFLFTSVWFWQVAGYSFSHVFTNRFALSDA